MAKQKFVPNYTIGTPGLDMAGLRSKAQAEPELFMHDVQRLVNEEGLRWQDIKNVADLYHATADVDVQAHFPIAGRTRAVMSSAFPLLSGALTIAGINDAYEAVPTISQDLVTEMNDNKRNTIVAGILSDNPSVDGVKEGDAFPEIGASEEKFEVRHKRNGRRLSITAEMIEENDVTGIVDRVNAIGEISAEMIEEQSLSRICDQYGSATSPAEPYVLHYNGAAAALFQTDNDPLTRLSSSGNRYTINALVDTTDLENVRLRLASHTNSRGKRINIPASQCTILVPNALYSTALKIRGSELEPSVENELNAWGPRGAFQPKVLSSPKLDDISTTAWYYGDFKKQYRRKWKLNFEYVMLGNMTESFLTNRIAAQFRIAWDCEVGAVDYVYVIQSLSSTTAP